MTVSIRYIVDNVEAAIDFYTSNLGFELEMHPGPGFAAMSRGDLTLLVNAPGAGGAGTAGGDPKPGGWNRFQIQVEDLDAWITELSGRGVRFRGDPVEGRGGSQVLVEDPSGNLIELFASG